MTIAVLAVAAYLTATLSGVLGMGGGVTLVGVMAAVLPPALVVPLHGVVQLCSNCTRTIVFLPHVRWRFVAVFAPFLLLGVGGATAVWAGADLGWFKPFIGLFLLLFVVTRRSVRSLRRPSLWIYAPLGAVTGFLSLFVGATGPFLAPFFLRDDFEKEEVIATKAMCQAFTHVLKIPAFLALGFDYLEHLDLLVLLVLMVVVGTITGKKLLAHLDPRLFERLFIGLLTILAIHLLAGWALDRGEAAEGAESAESDHPEASPDDSPDVARPPVGDVAPGPIEGTRPMSAPPIAVLGLLEKQQTVGYRSPYRLVVIDSAGIQRFGTEGDERVLLELRGNEAALEGLLGETVRVEGSFREVPGGPAPPGSEAASRFVDGEVPAMRWFEVLEVEVR